MEKGCLPVVIITPKKYVFHGLWFGGRRPKRGIVFVHGLGSNVFAHHNFLTPLAGKDTAVLFFNNRGHDTVAGIRRGRRRKPGGKAHEIFTECVDDIQGAVNLLRKAKAKKIYLVGHSTGCQKIAYYLSQKNKQRKISGAALLCPISDYAGIKKFTPAKKLKRAQATARKLVTQKKPHDLLPKNIWPELIDAQRFLSLYTPESKEEIFPYAQPGKAPRALQKIIVPLLTMFAGNDEYRDRSIKEIAAWFKENVQSRHHSITIVPKARHSFKGKEAGVVRAIRKFIARAPR